MLVDLVDSYVTIVQSDMNFITLYDSSLTPITKDSKDTPACMVERASTVLDSNSQ